MMRPPPETEPGAVNYLIIGGTGMLGRDLARALDGREVTARGSSEVDVADPASVIAAVAGFDVVINAAAYTQVDAAERNELQARRVNAVGAQLVARAAHEAGAKLVHVSTDYVFSGRAHHPYAEDSPLDPQNAYGRTKAEGEILASEATNGQFLLVRTAWLYGAGGPNFAATIAARVRAGQPVKVVDDQVGQPSWTGDVAEQIVRLLDNDAPSGIYHATNSGQASWFEFARAIAAELDVDPRLVAPTDSSSFPRDAQRPAYSVLGHDAWQRAGLTQPRDWRSALTAAVAAGVLGPR